MLGKIETEHAEECLHQGPLPTKFKTVLKIHKIYLLSVGRSVEHVLDALNTVLVK
jgi:hypothetical protein